MKNRFIWFFIYTMSFLLIVSCSSRDTQTDYGYLDDNLSDRWDLAKDLLGKDVTYFDTTNYSKIAKLHSTANMPNENLKIIISMQTDLGEVLKSIDSEKGKLAISGISSMDSLTVIIDAFKEFEGSFSSGVSILYIGEVKHKRVVQRIVEEKGASFSFAKKPRTSA